MTEADRYLMPFADALGTALGPVRRIEANAYGIEGEMVALAVRAEAERILVEETRAAVKESRRRGLDSLKNDRSEL